MISVRRHYYGHEHGPFDSAPHGMASIRFGSQHVHAASSIATTGLSAPPSSTTAEDPEANDLALRADYEVCDTQAYSERAGF